MHNATNDKVPQGAQAVRKDAKVTFTQVHREFKVIGVNGVEVGEADDYIIAHEDGSRSVCKKADFSSTYDVTREQSTKEYLDDRGIKSE